jgi:hypothetical protein
MKIRHSHDMRKLSAHALFKLLEDRRPARRYEG